MISFSDDFRRLVWYDRTQMHFVPKCVIALGASEQFLFDASVYENIDAIIISHVVKKLTGIRSVEHNSEICDWLHRHSISGVNEFEE